MRHDVQQPENDAPEAEDQDSSTNNTDTNTGSGVKGKFKSFWEKKIVPAFPEAIADVSIIKSALKVETTITKDLKNTTKHPEVTKIAVVRRDYELSPEELKFRELRKVNARNAFCRYMGLKPGDVHVDDEIGRAHV